MNASRLLALSLAAAAPAAAVDFKSQILPVLNNKCAECHSVARDKVKGKFAIDRQEDLERHLKPGEPAKSTLFVSVTLPDNDEDVMPPKGKNRLTPAEVAAMKTWIEEGASFDAATAAAPASSAPAAGGVLDWTNTEGRVVRASFGGMQGESVVLVTEDGARHAYPLDKLSAESQAMARQLAGQ
jgi:mono/diheme cytochrome c family protein